MNKFTTPPVPFYNHFLFKESIDLKNELIKSTKGFKNTSSTIKDLIKTLNKFYQTEESEEWTQKSKYLKESLYSIYMDLKSIDNILFELQKNLQSSKIYNEDYQKQIRKECKNQLQKMAATLSIAKSLIEESELFIKQVGLSGNKEKSITKTYEDWLFTIQHLLSPEKRLIR